MSRGGYAGDSYRHPAQTMYDPSGAAVWLIGQIVAAFSTERSTT